MPNVGHGPSLLEAVQNIAEQLSVFTTVEEADGCCCVSKKDGDECVFLSMTGSQISCYPPSNFTAEQSHFVDAVCWDSLLRYNSEPARDAASNSLWIFKVLGWRRTPSVISWGHTVWISGHDL